MKIVNAIWEKRNLGVDVIEVTCTEGDTVEELINTIESIEAPYSVIKIPSGCIPLLFAAQNNGYRVIETSFHYEANLKNISVPRIYDRFSPFVEVFPASEQLKKKALEEIHKGEIFTTDRIAIDPYFSKQIAGQRYYNWCVEALNRGAFMTVACYKDEPVAFNISEKKQDSNGVVYGLIGGTYPNAMKKGLGFLLAQCEKECCKALNGKICAGTTSSNNLQSLRLHMRYGFEIESAHFVLVRHL